MKLVGILALVIPAFAAGTIFSSLVTDYEKENKPDENDIILFILNITFVISNSIILCNS